MSWTRWLLVAGMCTACGGGGGDAPEPDAAPAMPGLGDAAPDAAPPDAALPDAALPDAALVCEPACRFGQECVDGECVGDPGMRCNRLLNCVEMAGCYPGDLPCQEACRAQASAEAIQQLDALDECYIQTNCLRLRTCPQVCNEQQVVCYAAGGHGDQSCTELEACIAGCAPRPDASDCSLDCMADSTLDAVRLYQSYVGCLNTSGCTDNGDCDQICAEPRSACNADPGR